MEKRDAQDALYCIQHRPQCESDWPTINVCSRAVQVRWKTDLCQEWTLGIRICAAELARVNELFKHS
jgi:hypothetical protein